jgi:hypothetical protein
MLISNSSDMSAIRFRSMNRAMAMSLSLAGIPSIASAR